MPAPVVRVETTAAVLTRWPMPVLTAAESERAARMRWADDFVAAHLLAREAVGALLARDPAQIVVTQTCPTCGGPHGPPTVDGGHVSWSHTRGHVAAAASLEPVGVDVELVSDRRPVTGRLLARVATPAEAAVIDADPSPETAFLRMWVAKEALVKVGAIDLDAFGRTDVSAGRWERWRLTVSVHDGVVVGTAC